MEDNAPVSSRPFIFIIPRFWILNSDLNPQKEREEAINTAQDELNAIAAEHRVLKALQKNYTTAACQNCKP